MKELIALTSKTLPLVNKSYATFDIVGNTIGKYFDYKRETQLINAEIRKIEKQTEVIIAKIDSELKKELDANSKNLKKELARLKNIDKELESNRKAKSEILNDLTAMNMVVLKMDIPTKDKLKLLKKIGKQREVLKDIFESSNKLIDSMSNYNQNQLSNYNNIIDTEIE